ncbi:MAG: hypothetical protein IVW57_16510 [Ktedonobacterales bacterium]|nr:hypothetical protein [Ktedonobacterales bacterium]
MREDPAFIGVLAVDQATLINIIRAVEAGDLSALEQSAWSAFVEACVDHCLTDATCQQDLVVAIAIEVVPEISPADGLFVPLKDGYPEDDEE